jgi:hypothetical protein
MGQLDPSWFSAVTASAKLASAKPCDRDLLAALPQLLGVIWCEPHLVIGVSP